ncbi:MAG TPA: hypothetical protein VLI06_15210 [Solimonas sp.]|nr:hypothetical protein [Solimonas sp.]
MSVTFSKKPSTAASAPLLTLDDVRKLQADYDADMRLLQELPERIAKTKIKLDAARLFLPEGVDLAKPAASLFPLIAREFEEEEGTTWIGAISNILNSEQRGFTHHEIKDALKLTPLAERLSRSDKGFYGAIARLCEREELFKSGNLIFSKATKDAYERAGTDLPSGSPKTRAGSAAELVLFALSEYKDGLDGPQLKSLVAEMPEAPGSIRHHGQYIYNVLGSLISSGRVEKYAGKYKLKA